jgi:hypothetical protein
VGKAAVATRSISGHHRFASKFMPSEETIEKYIEADIDTLPEHRRRLSNCEHVAAAMLAANLRKRRLRPHTTWHLDEVFL